jgi:alpha-1,2-mannosyltransferase
LTFAAGASGRVGSECQIRSTSRAPMSTFNPALTVDTVPPLGAKQPGNQSRAAFYLLRIGMLFALVAFLSFCVMWIQWQEASPGISMVSGDFVGFWTTGRLALEGRAADAYSEVPLFFAQLALHKDPSWAYFAFFYPPYFLLLCATFAVFPYFPALCLWLVATCAVYAAALRAMVPKRLRERESVWLLFLGYPAVMVNAGFGQNGFLSTALLGGAAIWLDRQPMLAGVCLGCLSYKPQLGIVVPLALAVAGRWRCFATAAATVLILAAAATLAFGGGIWPAFIADMAEAQHNWMEAYNPLYLRYLITVFGAVRLHDGAIALAYVLQTAVSAVAMLMLVRALRSRPPGAQSGRAEIAAIAACIPFCSPFMLEYDLVILAVPMIWLLGEALRDGFRRGEGIALVFAYLAPALFKITAFDGAVKLSVIAAAALLFVMVLRRMKQAPVRPNFATDLEQPVPAGRLQECCAK